MHISSMPIWKVGHMNLYKELDIDLNSKNMISIVGAGGKTTTMLLLALELKNAGKKVLVTTTTAIMLPKKELYDNIVNLERGDRLEDIKDSAKDGSITVLLERFIKKDKIKGVSEEYLDTIFKYGDFDNILVEADGAKKKPIKAPREEEPLLPQLTTKVIGLVGLDALNKKIDEKNIHRLEYFLNATNSKEGETINEDIIIKLIEDEKGLFKNALNREKHLILNKADCLESIERAREIKRKLEERGIIKLNNIIITKLIDGEISL